MTNTMEPMYYVILTGIESGVVESSANNNILSIRQRLIRDTKKAELPTVVLIHLRGNA